MSQLGCGSRCACAMVLLHADEAEKGARQCCWYVDGWGAAGSDAGVAHRCCRSAVGLCLTPPLCMLCECVCVCVCVRVRGVLQKMFLQDGCAGVSELFGDVGVCGVYITCAAVCASTCNNEG
jgi:hypothetical protein